jgi:hypothetical protein
MPRRKTHAYVLLVHRSAFLGTLHKLPHQIHHGLRVSSRHVIFRQGAIDAQHCGIESALIDEKFEEATFWMIDAKREPERRQSIFHEDRADARNSIVTRTD